MIYHSFLSLRLKNLCQKINQQRLDALFVENQYNITYLTGFNSRDSYFFIKPNFQKYKKTKVFFITDFRYWQEAKRYFDKTGVNLVKINGSIFDVVTRLANLLKIKRLGFEAKELSFAEYKIIKDKLSSIEFIPTYDMVESLRETKSEEEIQKIRKAVNFNIETFQFIRKVIRPGLREKEICKLLHDFIRTKGLKPAFEPIVAAGQNSSFPHHISGEYKLKKNEIILIDMGVDFEGYKSDLTRVFFLGKIPHIVKKIYNIVNRAQEIALENIKPGVIINKIDIAARHYIKKEGFGKYFGHALGHGVGLQIHEEPYINSKNNNLIKKGMIFTLEPAIYLPKKFGIRIEDMVYFNGEKTEVLSADLNKST